jgi:hypothetical protein
MEEREKRLRRVALKCGDFARQLSYHRAINKYRDDLKLNFWIATYNNAIDLAVLDWFHLFGYHNDDLHWKNIVTNIPCFRNELHKFLKVNEKEFKAYWEEIKTYRDKDVAHIEIRPVSNVPEMTMALKAVSFYYQTVLKELSAFRNYGNWPADLMGFHRRSLKQAEHIVTIAYEATRNVPEKVF